MNKNYAKFEKPCVKKILDQLKISKCDHLNKSRIYSSVC